MNYITFSTVSTVSILGVFLVVFGGLGSVGVADDLGLICWHCPSTTPLSESSPCLLRIAQTHRLTYWWQTQSSKSLVCDYEAGLWVGQMEGTELQVTVRGLKCSPHTQVPPYLNHCLLIHLRHFIQDYTVRNASTWLGWGFPERTRMWFHACIYLCACMRLCVFACLHCLCLLVEIRPQCFLFWTLLTFHLFLAVIWSCVIKSVAS